MKKLLSILVAMLLLFSLTACNESTSTKNDKEEEKTVEVKKSGENVAKNKDDDEEKKKASKVKKEEVTEEEEDEEEDKTSKKKSKVKKEIVESEYTLMDNDYCLIKITGIDPDNKDGFKLDLSLENVTEDKSINVSLGNIAVDGLEVYASVYETIASGKKAKSEIVFDTDYNDIPENLEYSTIAMAFRVVDSDSYDTLATESFTIYPYGEDKAVAYEREAENDDEILIDKDNIKVTLLDVVEENGNIKVNLYLENNTDDMVRFSSENESINGYMMEGYLIETLNPGFKEYAEVEFFSTDLKKEDIKKLSDVEEIEFDLEVSDMSYNKLISENFVLEP